MRRGSFLLPALFLFSLTACDENSWNDWTFNPSGVYTRIEEKCGGQDCSAVPNFPINVYLPEKISINSVGLYFDNYPIFVLGTDLPIYGKGVPTLALRLFEENLLSFGEYVFWSPPSPSNTLGPGGVPPCFSGDPVFSVEVNAKEFLQFNDKIGRPTGTTREPGFEVIARFDQGWVGDHCPKDLPGTHYFYRANYVRTEGPIAPLERYETTVHPSNETPYPNYMNHPFPTDRDGLRAFFRHYFNLRTDLL